VDRLVDTARAEKAANHTPKEVAELAAVDAAVTAHLEGRLPENMFAPFTIIHDPNNASTSPPMVHWGNVDTGSMVNIMYSGVLNAFPELN
jgi:hypothetical protein